jgi:hypothetical protein
MGKEEALYSFWNSFGLPAYDEQTVPDDAVMPYITYETITDSINRNFLLTGSLWYKSTSWEEISLKSQEIASHLGQGGSVIPYNGGALWITRGTPFAQRISDPSDDSVRRIYININAEYLGSD